MSEPVDPLRSPQAASSRLFLVALAAPASAVRYVAGHVALAVVPVLVLLASAPFIEAGWTRSLLLMILTLAIWHRLVARQQPRQVQVQWQPGEGPHLSGRFDEREIAIRAPMVPASVGIEDDRLVFRTASADAAGTLSIACAAFASTGADKLRSACAMVMAGDATSLSAFAEANGLKCRKRPGSLGLLIVEARWAHVVPMLTAVAAVTLVVVFRQALFG